MTKGLLHKKQHLVAQVFGETMLLSEGKKVVFNQRSEIYMLFDLLQDPEELVNLAGTPEAASLEKKMSDVYRKWLNTSI